MAKKLQLRRGTTSQHSSFTGAVGEVTVDTDKDSLVVHDGSTAGGHPLAKSADITGKASLTGATFTGNIVFDNDNQIQFQEATSNGNAYVGLKAPTDMGATSSYTITLPNTSPGTSKILKTDGSTATQLTWADDVSLTAPSSAGTVGASELCQVDSNKDITGFRNVTLTGELDAATGDFSGDVDIDGTTNLDAVDIDGAVQIDNTVTVGVNDTGYDVKFFGATSGAYLLWDEDVDDLILAGAARAVVPEGNLVLGSTAVTSTAAELNILDGVTSSSTELNLLDGKTVVGDAVLSADNQWSGAQKSTVTTATFSSAGTHDFDLTATNCFKLTIGDVACELGFSNSASAIGQSGTIEVIVGNTVPTWAAEVYWAGGDDSAATLTASQTHVLAYYCFDTNKILVEAMINVST